MDGFYVDVNLQYQDNEVDFDGAPARNYLVPATKTSSMVSRVSEDFTCYSDVKAAGSAAFFRVHGTCFLIIVIYVKSNLCFVRKK